MNTTMKSKAADEDDDVIDLRNKMFIVYKVLQACIKEKGKTYSNISTLDRLVLFTGLPKGMLSKVLDKSKMPELTDVSKYEVFENPEIDLAIRQALITKYVTNKEVPTVESLNKALSNLSSHQILQSLKSCYIWKRLPNTKRVIIIERPERVIQRQRYLQQIDSYRKQKRCIVYVEEKIIYKSHPNFNYFKKYLPNAQNSYVVFVAVANVDGYIGGTILAGSSVLKCQELIEENFIKNILPRLPESSVIVLEDKPYFCKSLPIPTTESEKSYMINWLNINNIPHDESSHRWELLELIERFKIKGDLHKFDAIVQAHGHEILRRPQKTNYLNYFKPLWTNLLSAAEEKYTNSMITDKPPGYWSALEESLVAFERVVYSEDLDMEHVTDKILTMAKYDKVTVNNWANVECDEEEDTLKQEEFLIIVNNK